MRLRVSGRDGQRLGNNSMEGDEQASNGELEMRDKEERDQKDKKKHKIDR